MAVGLVARGENGLEGHVRDDRQRGKWQRVNGMEPLFCHSLGIIYYVTSANLSMWKYRHYPSGLLFFGLN